MSHGSKRKIFVLDTSVLLHDPGALYVFGDNIVAIPMQVIDELDSFKTRTGELAANAREVIRGLDQLRHFGRLVDGVPIPTGGICKIYTEDAMKQLSDSSDKDWPSIPSTSDNILRLAWRLHKMGEKTILVSKNIGARLKADALGLDVEDYKRQRVNIDKLYSGFKEFVVSDEIVEAFAKRRAKVLTHRHRQRTKSDTQSVTSCEETKTQTDGDDNNNKFTTPTDTPKKSAKSIDISNFQQQQQQKVDISKNDASKSESNCAEKNILSLPNNVVTSNLNEDEVLRTNDPKNSLVVSPPNVSSTAPSTSPLSPSLLLSSQPPDVPSSPQTSNPTAVATQIVPNSDDVDEVNENWSFTVPNKLIVDFLKDKFTVPLFPNEFVVLTKASNPKDSVILANDTPHESPLSYLNTHRNNEEHVNLNDIQKITEIHQQSKEFKEKEYFERNQNRPVRLRYLSSRSFTVWNVTARSKEQVIALEILQNPDIKLVTLVGQAGTGKTLLALAAGLEQIFRIHRYDGLLVTRPIVPMGKDIGALPGGKNEKLLPWMQPIFDNLAYLCPKRDRLTSPFSALLDLNLSDKDITPPPKPQRLVKKNRRARRKSSVSNQNSAPTNKTNNRSAKKSTKLHQEDQEEAEDESDKLVDRVTLETALSKIQMEALTYIRGRSIMNKYVIVDECQNLTPHEVKTVISRAGEGTKMILTGDPLQIDNPYLDSNSNGLSYAVERLKFTPIHGHVTLRSSERSELAAVAAELL